MDSRELSDSEIAQMLRMVNFGEGKGPESVLLSEDGLVLEDLQGQQRAVTDSIRRRLQATALRQRDNQRPARREQNSPAPAASPPSPRASPPSQASEAPVRMPASATPAIVLADGTRAAAEAPPEQDEIGRVLDGLKKSGTVLCHLHLRPDDVPGVEGGLSTVRGSGIPDEPDWSPAVCVEDGGRHLYSVLNEATFVPSAESIALRQASSGEKELVYYYTSRTYTDSTANARSGSVVAVAVRLPANEAESLYAFLKTHPEHARTFFLQAGTLAFPAGFDVWGKRGPKFPESDRKEPRQMIFTTVKTDEQGRPQLEYLPMEKTSRGWQVRELNPKETIEVPQAAADVTRFAALEKEKQQRAKRPLWKKLLGW